MSYLIQITGQVQGVGFRPFIYRLAQQKQLTGWVNNTTDGVFILINQNIDIQNFIEEIKIQKPPLAIIQNIIVQSVESELFSDFQIVTSESSSQPQLLITPDAACCPDCLKELFNPENHRFRYPFTTCTNCGPRYSIIQNIPYDRPFTTMNHFVMCSNCNAEYHNPNDRRFYSQTNSCPDCAVELSLYNVSNQCFENISQEEIIQKSIEILKSGKILAVKGIGGYMLMADATQFETVEAIRKRKVRLKKPLALMVRDIKTAEKYCELDNYRKEALQSTISPIVLCRKKENIQLAENVVFDNSFLGIMLPYTPLHHLLLETIDFPIVATSANRSSNPITFKEDFEALNLLADYIVSHNREIVVPQDDSVLNFSQKGQKIWLRRSRGLAPNIGTMQLPNLKKVALAMGGDLKNTFALWTKNNLLLSQYLGDYQNFEVQKMALFNQKHIENIYQVSPELLIVDKNPAYFTHTMALETSIPIQEIQHHEAHFWAILGDNQLIHNDKKVLGIIWDGTGLGNDGNSWGGEFFVYKNQQINRIAHLDEFNLLMNDKMAKEPRLSLLSLYPEAEILSKMFSSEEWNIFNKKLKNNTLKTSSIGRLIDAVACLLLNITHNQFEAEAAMLLEKEADNFLYKIDYQFNESYHIKTLNPFQLIQAIAQDENPSPPYKAAKFFNTLVFWIQDIAEKNDIQSLAFSGGVFQNSVLVSLIEQNLGDFTLYFHQNLSPNDENIAYGQIMSQSENLKA